MSELKELERQRNEVQSRIWEIENAENEKKSAALVGRYFKYHNSFGSGNRWWLYFKAVRVDGRCVVGPKFQRDSNGRFELEPDAHVFNNMSGYTEIKAVEYVRARAKFLTELNEGIGE